MPDLVIRSQGGKSSTIDLEARDRLSIGRGPNNDIVLQDPTLSRHHVELTLGSRGWVIRDMASRNGTYLNNRPMKRQTTLRPGDRIRFGRSELTFQPEESSRVVLADTPVSEEDTIVVPTDEFQLESRPDAWLDILDETYRTLANQPYDTIHDRLVDLVRHALCPKHAAVFSCKPGCDPICEAQWGGHDNADVAVSRTLASKIIDESVSVLIAESNLESLPGGRVGSAMAVPLRGRDGVGGFIYLESPGEGGSFSKKDLRRLTVLANAAATQIENAALFEERVREWHLQEQAREAAKIQMRLLPTAFPEIPGYEFEWHYVSCFEVGGDYCDCLALDGERHGIVVADVAGKGLGAAMLMAVTQATLRSYVQTGQDTDHLAEHLNSAIFTATPSNRFVTFFFCELDHHRHRLRYANVGHQPAPLLVRASGGIEELGAGAIPLGILPNIDCPAREIELEPGDVLFACSDGVTDAVDPEQTLFGEDRLLEVLASCAGAPVTKIRQAVERALEQHSRGAPQPDDLTMAVLRRIP